ncbi:MAG TPA: HlyD family secretion protein [Candidatus Dormibacteraeota bacterium]|nr:HlyD family secretion protein [Candidatus Dormibacteraeota bacterium]
MDEAKPQEASKEPKKLSFWKTPIAILVGTVVLILLLFLGLRYLADSLTHESTDDAFLDGPIVSIAPRVAGQVAKVFVSNNQLVQRGAPLLELDNKDFAIQLDQKKAATRSAEANVDLLKTSLDLLRAQIESADAIAKQSAAEVLASEAASDKAQADLKRAQDLLKQNAISPQEFDASKAASSATEANLGASREKAASDQSKIAQAKAQFEAGVKAYERSQAQTRQAELDTKAAELTLSYARVDAPEDGFVTRKSVEPGDYVQAGQKLMALVARRLWVTANFKETQLNEIRTNQPVSITVDSLGGRKFRGHVESVQAGGGARFSLLPPENAVGNYVKVVQRVPVRIFFDENVEAEHVLGPGMSVVPSVLVKSSVPSEALVFLAAIVLGLLIGSVWWLVSRRRT